MQLVTDAAFRVECQHGGAFVAQGVRVLVSSEFPPCRVEFSGHAEEVQPQIPRILGRHRKVVVSPASCRQRFQLQVAEVLEKIPAAPLNMARVVEDRHVGALAQGCGGRHLIVSLQCGFDRLRAILLALGIQAICQHVIHAPSVANCPLRDDIQKNAIAIGKQLHNFADLLAQIVHVGAEKIHRVESRLQDTCRPPLVFSIIRYLPPLRMLVARQIIHTRRQINRSLDANFLAGIILGAQKIERQMRVHFPDFCRMVAPAVVALGKESDRVDPGIQKRLLPVCAIKVFPNIGNVRRCVVIEVDLAEWEQLMFHVVKERVDRILCL